MVHRGGPLLERESVGRTIRQTKEVRQAKGSGGQSRTGHKLYWVGDLPAMEDSQAPGFSNSEMGLHWLSQGARKGVSISAGGRCLALVDLQHVSCLAVG